MVRDRSNRRFLSELHSKRRKTLKGSSRDTIDGRPISEIKKEIWDSTPDLDAEYSEEPYFDMWHGLPIQ